MHPSMYPPPAAAGSGSFLAARVQHELTRRSEENVRVSVVGPQAADVRTALVGGAFHQPGYVHDAMNPGMAEYVGPTGPTFPHVPTVVRPVPLGGVDQYHVASDPPLSSKCTLKEKYEPCSVDHRTGYDRYGNLDYAEYAQRTGFYQPQGH